MQNNRSFDLLVQVLQRGRTLLQVFENDEKIEVEVKFGKLLRNSNPSLSFLIESDKLSSELGFWSTSKSGEIAVYDNHKSEVIEGYSYEVTTVEDIDEHFNKIIKIYTEMI